VIKAVVDIGSNSVLLLVAEQQGSQWHPILETSEVTALGEGTAGTRLLSEKGMADTLAALKRAFRAAQDRGAEEIIAGITMAGRIATNTSDFLARAQKQATPAFVLTGEQEAELGFWAVADDPLFRECAEISIIDVGGQSTEVVFAVRQGPHWKTEFRNSFPIGTLALRENILSAPAPDGPARFKATVLIDELLGDVKGGGTAVCLGATGTNLVSIRDHLATWQPERVHGAILSYEEIGRAVGWLCSMNDKQRATLIGIEPGRERSIHIGTLILERVMNAIRVEECAVSVRGWRHALLERGLPD